MYPRLPPFVGVLAVMGIALAGCTATSTETPQASESSPSPTVPAIDPGPVTLSVEEAGERYLDIVCPTNAGIAELTAAFDAGEQEFLDGGAPDPAAVKQSATNRVNSTRSAIEHLDDSYFTWPDAVAAQLPHVRSSFMSEVGTLSAMSNAATFEEAYYATWAPRTAEQDTAAQEIRYQLGLPADTVASCSGHEDGHEQLAAERSEREALLAEASTE